MPIREDMREVDSEEGVEKEAPIKTLSESFHTKKSKKFQAEHVSHPVKPYNPPVPYPQRLLKAKEKQKYGKFLETIKQFHINISFLEAITDMPSYAQFLKDLLSIKRKLLKNATVFLSEECSTIILNKLPPKLSDLGSFSIPCSVGEVTISSALCDLGASVSLYSTLYVRSCKQET